MLVSCELGLWLTILDGFHGPKTCEVIRKQKSSCPVIWLVLRRHVITVMYSGACMKRFSNRHGRTSMIKRLGHDSEDQL